MEIRFSRHAKNKLRLYKVSPEEIGEIINSGEMKNQGNKWESRKKKFRVIWTMIGSYSLVITVIKTR